MLLVIQSLLATCSESLFLLHQKEKTFFLFFYFFNSISHPASPLPSSISSSNSLSSPHFLLSLHLTFSHLPLSSLLFVRLSILWVLVDCAMQWHQICHFWCCDLVWCGVDLSFPVMLQFGLVYCGVVMCLGGSVI